MLRQKCFYKNDIETHKKAKSKWKIQLKFAKLPAENADIWWLH